MQTRSFRLEFDMDNAAFEHDEALEIRRILYKIVDETTQADLGLRNALEHQPIVDHNGNQVGSWRIKQTGNRGVENNA